MQEKRVFWTEQVLPKGWLGDFLFMIGKVQIMFARGIFLQNLS